MSLAYQGRNDRDLKVAYASLFTEKIAPFELPRRTGKPHVGVVVTDGHEGVYAECFGRLVIRLANSRDLDVTVVCSRAGANILKHLLGESRVRYLLLADRVPASASRIAAAEIDLIHYWEVGTDSTNYFLPFYRAAPVQSACWGWPITTGNPHIRYFISSEQLEPANAADHYTETVVELASLPTWYVRPPVPQYLKSRAMFGISERTRVYLCTQNLRKLHPDFDSVLADILVKDDQAEVHVIADSQPTITRLWTRRFEQRFAALMPRVILIPRQERQTYLNLVANADVILDSIYYGGGANSLYDSVACGTPFVTWPGEFHRGRYGQAVCKALGIGEMIATSPSDVATRAIQIATQSDYRRALQQKIRDRSHVLFETDSAITEHEQFFLEAIETARSVS